MSLWDRLKGELIDIVEYIDETQNTLVHRFERMNNEIKNGAELIVRESQAAVFVREGQVADVFQPGHYKLDTNSLPVLSTLLGWKHGFESPFKSEVYFVNVKLFTGYKWGTQNPVPLRDADFGMLRIRAFGSYNFQVADPAMFVKEISGTNGMFTIEGISDQMRSLVVSQFTDALGELKIPALDLASQYNELGETIQNVLNKKFEELGLRIRQFTIENISMPKEVEEALDTRAKMGALGVNYMTMKAGDALENASMNQGDMGGMMGAGMGLGMGVNMGGMMSQAMQGGGMQQQPPAAPGGPPPIPGQVQYFVAVNGQQQGPYPVSQLQQYAQGGQFTRESLVWSQGMAQWTKAGEVPELAQLFASTPPPPPPPPPQ